MKLISTFLITWILVSHSYSQASDNLKTNPYFEFNDYIIDFDTIREGEKLNISFHFENIYHTELSIANVKSSCGCTSPYWPRTTLMPGDKDSIRVTYNSTNKPNGKETRRIEVFHSASSKPIYLTLQGYIISDKKLPDVPSLMSSDTLSLKELHQKQKEFEQVDELTKLLADMFDKDEAQGVIKFEDIYIIDTISMDEFTVKLNTLKVFELTTERSH